MAIRCYRTRRPHTIITPSPNVPLCVAKRLLLSEQSSVVKMTKAQDIMRTEHGKQISVNVLRRALRSPTGGPESTFGGLQPMKKKKPSKWTNVEMGILSETSKSA